MSRFIYELVLVFVVLGTKVVSVPKKSFLLAPALAEEVHVGGRVII